MNIMKTTFHSSRFIAALLALTLCGAAHGLKPMSAEYLSRSCETSLNADTGVEDSACAAFIKGYIEANSHIRIGEMGDRSFTQRALLSRAPSGSTSINTLKTVKYCLSESTTIRELATLVVDESSPTYTGTAASLLEQIFKAHYLC